MTGNRLRGASLVCALLGLAVSVYLTIEHYTTSAVLACPATSVLNCQRVTTSPRSVLLGVPVALLGVVFFAVMAGLTTPIAWRSFSPAVRWARVGAAAAGVAFAIYLISVELFVVDAVCLWCTVVHALALALFALIAFATAELEPDGAGRSRSGGARPPTVHTRRTPVRR